MIGDKIREGGRSQLIQGQGGHDKELTFDYRKSVSTSKYKSGSV